MNAHIHRLTASLRPTHRTKERRAERSMPHALPQAIAKRLQALSHRTLLVSWAEGILWILIAACSLALVQGMLDWLFDLSLRVRAAFLMADFAILGLLFFRFGISPWWNRLTPDEAALRAERQWPALRTGLISAVQLARRPDGSPALVEAMLAQMARRIAPFDLRGAVPWVQLKRLCLVAVAALLLTGGLMFAFAPKSLLLLERIALRNVPLPTETMVAAISGNFSIPVGQSIELSARATGVIPRSGRIEIVYEGRRPERVTVTPKASSPDVFSLQLPNIQQPLTYRFYLNDGRGEEWHVELIHPPVVSEIAFEVTPPAYTKLMPTPLSAGSLTLLAGSQLGISGKSNAPLGSARLVTEGEERTVPMKPQGSDQREFQATLDVPPKGLEGFRIELTNQRDVVSQNNTVYAVTVVPDKPPEILFAEGQPEKMNLITTQLPRRRFEVRDDFQVQQVFLCVQPLSSLGEGEEPNPEKAKLIPIPVPQASARLAVDFEWKDPEKSVDWAEGQSFTCWIKAVDNNDVTGPGISYSAPWQWSVVSLQTKREELADQLRRHAESIKDLSGVQESVRKDLGEWLKQEKTK